MQSMRMKSLVQRAALALGIGLLSACGGGGGGSGGGESPGGTALKAGIYEGTITSRALGQPDQILAAEVIVLPDGETRLLADNCVQAIGTVNISGAAATGMLRAFAPFACNGLSVDFSFPDGSKEGLVNLSVTYQNDTLTGSFNGVGQTGTVAFTRDAALTDRGASLGQITGNYAITGLAGSAMSIDASGRLSGSDILGWYDGSVSVVDPALNVYRVNFDYNEGTGPTIRFAGLAVLTDSPAGANRRLIVQVNSPIAAVPLYLLTVALDRQ